MAKPKSREFVVNKKMLMENLEANSCCAQDLVYDAVKATNKEVHEVRIENKILLPCSSASSRYKLALKENRKVRCW